MPKTTDEKPRSFLFHLFANMVFASLALFGGMLFGESLSKSRMALLPILIPLIGLAMIPLTRRWERNGVEKRRAKEAEAKAQAKADRKAARPKKG